MENEKLKELIIRSVLEILKSYEAQANELTIDSDELLRDLIEDIQQLKKTI
jgi:hypothetical protein